MSECDESGRERKPKVSERKPVEDDGRRVPVASAPHPKQSRREE